MGQLKRFFSVWDLALVLTPRKAMCVSSRNLASSGWSHLAVVGESGRATKVRRPRRTEAMPSRRKLGLCQRAGEEELLMRTGQLERTYIQRQPS